MSTRTWAPFDAAPPSALSQLRSPSTQPTESVQSETGKTAVTIILVTVSDKEFGIGWRLEEVADNILILVVV